MRFFRSMEKRNTAITRTLLVLNIIIVLYHTALAAHDLSWSGHWFGAALSMAAVGALLTSMIAER